MVQKMIRSAAVFLMTFLCSQSFAGVLTGGIAINPEGGTVTQISNSVQFDGTTLQLSNSSISDLEFLGILAPPSTGTGFLSVSSVAASGPVVAAGANLFQQTTKGGFTLNDQNGNLLLSGMF